MFGAVVGALVAEHEVKRRNENGEAIWDAMVWVLPFGILGARLWYVASNILSGSTYYTEDPSFLKVINTLDGGLHFFGGLLFGGITLLIYLNKKGFDFWLFLDAIAPAVFIGQALARPANFINQELYGQTTNLPWGIKIDPSQPYQVPPSMLGHSQQEVLEYLKVTRFHPTFAYEMILNILLALLLLWISRQYRNKIKPGALFSTWLVFAGLARTFIEFFRPDQPRIGASFVSYTMLVSFLMAVAGVVMLLIRYRILNLAPDWADQYQVKPAEKEARVRREKPAARELARAKKIVVAQPENVNPVAEMAAPIEAKDAVILPEKPKRTVKAKAAAKKSPAVKKPAAKASAALKKTAVKKTPAKTKTVVTKKSPPKKTPATKAKAPAKKSPPAKAKPAKRASTGKTAK
jgi:phosphatidylglycerol:prolipoprotein diacylglycerol transferase